jgi:acetoacetyl-CoA reductase
MGKPHEIGSLVSYLSSEEAAFITGATFSVNGGQYLA